jgi:hypothetical protein
MFTCTSSHNVPERQWPTRPGTYQMCMKSINRNLEFYQPLGSLAVTSPALSEVLRAHLLCANTNTKPQISWDTNYNSYRNLCQKPLI